MTGFLRPEEQTLAHGFLTHGQVVVPAEDQNAFTRIRDHVAALAAAHLGLPIPAAAGPFLDTIHQHVGVDGLNALRLAVIDGLNAEPWVRGAYFATARRTLEVLVGNELAMQLRLNLSIQLPGDDSSLLPVHADVWNGDSPYEVVLWVPLVDCQGTKSMFLLPPEANQRYQDQLGQFQSAEKLFRAIEPHVRWMDLKAGEIMVFSQNLMHGNRVNREAETRWSLNCRFKGLFTPYADKRLGEFFEPITLRPATRLGAAYALPRLHENG